MFQQEKRTDTKAKPPQPCGSWPVIGHLHLLGELPHITLGKSADKYGQIFMIKLGIHQALVVSTAEMAKECLGSTNDKSFLNRPQKIFIEHMAYNGAMLGFSQYGQYWREMRKITTIELLSAHQVEIFKHVRISEVRSAMKSITVASQVIEEFYQGEEYNRCVKAFRDFFELAGVFVPTDALPFLRWFDIRGYEKKNEEVAKEIGHIAQRKSLPNMKQMQLSKPLAQLETSEDP
uniref:Cytochrome P450 n=1 Tax=Chenopodium quinoa TaxID=63459 RepID=A0A803LJS6_CHEQI